MKLLQEIGANKLRGAFYTPPPIVDFCYRRLFELRNHKTIERILEPSAGDGAFVQGLRRICENSNVTLPRLTCVELDACEAAKCDETLHRSCLEGDLFVGSFFEWASHSTEMFDAVVGNPPFIRYQFASAQDRVTAELMLRANGFDLKGVSNVWIPLVLLSLLRLKSEGVFAFVLPGEFLSTLSSGLFRSALLRNFCSMRVDFFSRESFPDILQDVIVVSGMKSASAPATNPITFSDFEKGVYREWQYRIPVTEDAWTPYLLTSEQHSAFERARNLTGFYPLKQIATIGVAIVTGANDFFTVDDTTLQRYGLQPWARPLLGRTSESPGVRFTQPDFEAALKQGKKVWLLDFSAENHDPIQSPGAKQYLKIGEEAELPERYKCRIRSPWYRVPHIKYGSLMMSKRSHQGHRLILNECSAFTTDTIYRGEMKPEFKGCERALVAGFHNSLTLLSAELQGRTYGGGVLELIPSEVAQIRVPLLKTEAFLSSLDQLSRETGGQLDREDRLTYATDVILAQLAPDYAELVSQLREGRNRLRSKRFCGSNERS